MLADTLGRPLRFILTAGQTGDITTAPALLDGLRADAVLADKAYDSDHRRHGRDCGNPFKPDPKGRHSSRHGYL
jgi:IS5 family transposase